MSSGESARRVRRTLLTEDGERISAQLLQQANSTTEPPVVGAIVVHGFSGSVEKPINYRVIERISRNIPVIAFDMRGHGASSGECTLGDREVADVGAAVTWARSRGWSRIVLVGFSMGAAVVVRYAGIVGGVAGVVSVSGPAFWNYRGTPVMRRLHFGVENPMGRQFVRRVMKTRVIEPPWPEPWPESPFDAAAHIAPTPFLVVHGTQDEFFPMEHPRALIHSARQGAVARDLSSYEPQIWLRNFGHAEAAISDELLDAVAGWCLSCATPVQVPESQ